MPRWFAWLCGGLAVAFSVWTGLHFGLPRQAAWMALYATVAVTIATLPTGRSVGLVGLAIGGIVLGCGGYLMKGAWHALELRDVWGDGPIVSGAREAAVMALALVWLFVGSTLRILRP